MGILSKSPGGTKSPETGGSKKMKTNVGAGSRPTKSKHPIPTSAPMDQQKLGRAPKGALK